MNARGKERTRDAADTPMMRQYMAIKDNHPEAILMYRMGDFYEMFYEDAIIAAKALDLTLTSRNRNAPDPVPMCGIPHHASVGYISRLIAQGFKVAVCEQLEDPAKVKGLVKRDVVRVITPGVIIEEENLDARANNYLAAIVSLNTNTNEGPDVFALSAMDASTGEFRGTRITGVAALTAELFRLEPREIVVAADLMERMGAIAALLPHCCVTAINADLLDQRQAADRLNAILGEDETSSLLASDPLLFQAAGTIAGYLASTRPMNPLPASRFQTYCLTDHLLIDETTKRHLELIRTLDGERKGTLLWLLDHTCTPMGGRLLRTWINYPLCDADAIQRRLARVELFTADIPFLKDTRAMLERIGDIERIATRICMNVASPRDIGALRNMLAILPQLDDLLTSCRDPAASDLLGDDLDRAEDLVAELFDALVEDPPVSRTDGSIFRIGFHAGLDELRTTLTTAKDFIAALETKERQRTGIASLKVSYNKMFGYFILITKANLKHAPDNYIRKQTLVNGERFVTPELQEWESRVLTADDRQKALEKDLFERLVGDLQGHVQRLLAISARVASLDGAACLAHVAREHRYVRPTINDRGTLHIVDGRHPVVEATFTDVPFVPNDIHLDTDTERLMIITGPNMAGKSTVMRQVALMVILAQMGSFVPATEANLPVTDRLFTRVGASDNIARGASTFMVEMTETASILRNATPRSLVILDEVGRGTSTYDGLSIAWSVGEYLHDVVRCKTLFATHYHELIELANSRPAAVNRHVAAREYGEEVVFLRKLIEGGTSHSFGIQVGRMAGLPEQVVARAREILSGLEAEDHRTPGSTAKAARSTPQLDLFSRPTPSEVERLLRDIDLNRVTPLEALSLLTRLKEML